MKLLILCTGNNYSSRMAHGFLQSFEDPSHEAGTDAFIGSEFRRVRDDIKHRL